MIVFRLLAAIHISLDKAQPFKSSVPNTNKIATAHHLSKLVKAALRQNAAASRQSDPASPEQRQYDVDLVRDLGEKKLCRFHQNIGKSRCVCIEGKEKEKLFHIFLPRFFSALHSCFVSCSLPSAHSDTKKQKARRTRRCAHRVETAVRVFTTNRNLWNKTLAEDRSKGDDAKFPLVTDEVIANEVCFPRVFDKIFAVVSLFSLFCNSASVVSSSCRLRLCLRWLQWATTSSRATTKGNFASFGTST
jgi:hypothetical protein